MNEQQELDAIMDKAKPTTEPLDEAKEIVKAERRPTELTGGKVQLRDASQVADLAAFVARSGMKIGGATSPADITLALMAGLEAGLTATQTIKNIMVVNGRPTIWGDALKSLVLGSGQCTKLDTVIEGEGDERVAVCTIGRRITMSHGEPSDVTITRTFSVADAKKAGLWGKAGPWKNYDERMLCNRASTFGIRDLFADFIGGLSVREEVEDYRPAFNPDRMSTRPSVAGVIEEPE